MHEHLTSTSMDYYESTSLVLIMNTGLRIVFWVKIKKLRKIRDQKDIVAAVLLDFSKPVTASLIIF